MKLRRTIDLMLAVVVIVGLASAPLVTPAAAHWVTAAEMVDMSAMMGDMSCCAEGHETEGCKDCPLIAVCTLTVALAEPASSCVVRVSFHARPLSFALYDLAAEGVLGVPPYHPPRI